MAFNLLRWNEVSHLEENVKFLSLKLEDISIPLKKHVPIFLESYIFYMFNGETYGT